MLPPPLPRQVEVLLGVLDRVAVASGDGGLPPLAIFGIDGTLLDPRARTLHILAQFGEEVRAADPEVAEALASLSLRSVQTLLGDTLRECGLTHPGLVRRITQFWRTRFYEEAYLELDHACPGAAEYVRRVHDAGATIVYFSRRDVPGMLAGTVASLRDHGFPIGVAGVELVMKPDATLADESFLRQFLPTVTRSGDIVAFFDCGISECEYARAIFPDASVGLVDHWPPDPYQELPGVDRIHDFRLG